MTSRALLVKIKRDLENQIRGQSRSLTRTSLNHPVCMMGRCRPHRYGRSYRRELGRMNGLRGRAYPVRSRARQSQAGVSSTDQAAFVSHGHNQRRFALPVHAAEPARVKKVLMPLPIIDAIRLSYLHRHTAARAGVAIAGNYNRLSSSSFHLPAHPITVMNRRDGARKRLTLTGILLFSV